MNQNHPSQPILDLLANGQLEDTVSIVATSHASSCKQCRTYLSKKEEQLATEQFNSTTNSKSMVPDFSQLQESIIQKTESSEYKVQPLEMNKTLLFKNKVVDLPPILQKIKKNMSPWKSFGNISYSKINVHGASNMFLVHFEPGAKISEHSHEGNEYAYVLAGSFKDQHSEYITGDFASFSHHDSHHPYTEDPDGCMLLVSIDGPFVFKEGWSRLLNPFRKLFFKNL